MSRFATIVCFLSNGMEYHWNQCIRYKWNWSIGVSFTDLWRKMCDTRLTRTRNMNISRGLGESANHHGDCRCWIKLPVFSWGKVQSVATFSLRYKIVAVPSIAWLLCLGRWFHSKVYSVHTEHTHTFSCFVRASKQKLSDRSTKTTTTHHTVDVNGDHGVSQYTPTHTA